MSPDKQNTRPGWTKVRVLSESEERLSDQACYRYRKIVDSNNAYAYSKVSPHLLCQI